MIQYSARFIPSLATISAPLHLLTCKYVKWAWTGKEHAAFDELKKLLTMNTVMGYFDPLKQMDLYVDASPVCLYFHKQRLEAMTEQFWLMPVAH